MKEHSEKTAHALETALQMEKEGQEFYYKAEQKSKNRLTKNLFRHLAEQETVHMKIIKEIYQKISGTAVWPLAETTFKHEKSLRNVFQEAIDSMDKEVKASSDEIEALQTAMNLEDKSYSYYNSRADEAVFPAEKSFYQALTAEERGHYLAVLNSYEYLTDPQAWFMKEEHWSLDGA
jgi:rubrerythrin